MLARASEDNRRVLLQLGGFPNRRPFRRVRLKGNGSETLPFSNVELPTWAQTSLPLLSEGAPMLAELGAILDRPAESRDQRGSSSVTPYTIGACPKGKASAANGLAPSEAFAPRDGDLA